MYYLKAKLNIQANFHFSLNLNPFSGELMFFRKTWPLNVFSHGHLTVSHFLILPSLQVLLLTMNNLSHYESK